MEIFGKKKPSSTLNLPGTSASGWSTASKKITPNLNVSSCEKASSVNLPGVPIVSRNISNDSTSPENNNDAKTTNRKRIDKGKKKRNIRAGVEVFAPSAPNQDVFLPSKARLRKEDKVGVADVSIASNKAGEDNFDCDEEELLLAFQNTTLTNLDDIPGVPFEHRPVCIPRTVSRESDEASAGTNRDLMDQMIDMGNLFLLKTPKKLPVQLTSIGDEFTPEKQQQKKEKKTKKKDKKKKMMDHDEADDANQTCPNTNSIPTKTCPSIHDLPSGRVGEIQKLKSGRWRLVMGDCIFNLDHGVPVNSKEQLAVVDVDEKSQTGDIKILGTVKNRLVAVPKMFE